MLRKCEKCVYPCKNCKNKEECLSCVDEEYPDSRETPECSCKTGYYENE